MKVLKTNNFISERIKIRPITNAEFDKVQKELERTENPFGITEKDLTGDIKYFPMGLAVRMLEEQQMQENTPDVTIFQKDRKSAKNAKGFNWDYTKAGWTFWNNVIDKGQFSWFFETYPEYKKYNIRKTTPNKYNITEKDLVDDLKDFPVSVVVRMLEEQEKQENKADVTVFQKNNTATAFARGFNWKNTAAGHEFWDKVVKNKKFMIFFEKYPKYIKYNIY